MKEVYLSKGQVAFIDDEDWEAVSSISWHVSEVSHNSRQIIYAATNLLGRPRGEKTFMHRMILRAEHHQLVDHRNFNGLDNRRENLRICTHSQNAMNARKRASGRETSKFKGVSLTRLGWRARITLNGKTVSLGYFDSEIVAARAYNEAAKEYFREYAELNTY